MTRQGGLGHFLRGIVLTSHHFGDVLEQQLLSHFCGVKVIKSIGLLNFWICQQIQGKPDILQQFLRGMHSKMMQLLVPVILVGKFSAQICTIGLAPKCCDS